MKAVIMAGGEGSRLRPLTCNMPKPMAPLCGRPVMEYILELLAVNGIKQAAVTLQYLPDVITDYFSDGVYQGITLEFVEEKQPLGTAGSVKNAASPEDELLLVISGDAMCDFDLRSALEQHKNSGSDATLIVTKVDDPREYGLVVADAEKNILGFVEKPAFSQAISDLANTGIYILSKSAIDLIPQGIKFDFAKDLFPQMLSLRMKLTAFACDGYWCDIGDLASYAACQRDMLLGKVRCTIHGRRDQHGNIYADTAPEGEYLVIPPVYFGRHVTIGKDTVIASGTVIEDGCTIGENAAVTGSIILRNSFLDDGVQAKEAIVCAGSSIKEKAVLFEGSTAGSGCCIGAHAQLSAGVKVWNNKVVGDGVIVREHVKQQMVTKGYFDDDGILGQVGVELTPEFCAKLGSALGSISRDLRIGIGCSDHGSAQSLKAALAAGISSAGVNVVDFGKSYHTLFLFGMSFCAVRLGVFIQSGTQASIKIVSDYGLPITREVERNLEAVLSRGEFTRADYAHFGECSDLSAIETLYRSELLKTAPAGLDGVQIQVGSHNEKVRETLSSALQQLGCRVGKGLTVHISSQGESAQIMNGDRVVLPYHKLLALGCMAHFEQGKDVALPYDAPRAFERLALDYGRKLHRYFLCPADTSDREARRLAVGQLWTRDAMLLTIKALELANRKNKTLTELAEELPQFDLMNAQIEITGNPARLIQQFNMQKTAQVTEGVTVRDQRGVVLIRPTKKGLRIKVFAEAVSREIAEELCHDYMLKISNLLDR